MKRMMAYYNAIVALSCATLFILMVLIHENGRLRPEQKRRFYATYGVIATAAAAEWLSVLLNGAPLWTRGLHGVLKGMDYAFTPVVGIMFIRQISPEGKGMKFITAVLLANILLQFSSLFTGWVYYIDADNVYRHGEGYFSFILVYVVVILYAAWQFYGYSRNYRRHNKVSLYMAVALIAAGMIVQEATDGQIRVSYIALTLGAVLMFIHSNEFNQQTTDDTLSRQRELLETDALTGLKSRYAYSEALNALNAMDALPEDTVAFMIDSNGLKAVNDTCGHKAGDELIAGVAGCVLDTFAAFGECYRTGGDEFVAIIRVDEGRLPELCARLEARVGAWKGTLTRSASLSYGYASLREFPEMSIEKLVSIADERMYWRKAEYYRQMGHDRRRQGGERPWREAQ